MPGVDAQRADSCPRKPGVAARRADECLDVDAYMAPGSDLGMQGVDVHWAADELDVEARRAG